ncbi:MAG: hypothetical protein EPN48_09150 [Microbacteriaceae bacterium]|nr:MAG: hypothetical protein EPN48_09150 [Microbacteriaceae bacterium]
MTVSRLAAFGVALAGVVMLTGAPLPAAATTVAHSDNGIVVSADGTHFAGALATPLLDPTHVIIAGGSESASLYIRNDSTQPTVITLHAMKVSYTSMQLARLLQVSASADGGVDGAPVRLSDGECLPLISAISLPAGITTHVMLTLVMSAGASGAEGQHGWAAFNVIVSARDPAAPAIPGATCTAGLQLTAVSDPRSPTDWSERGGLADTGSELLVPLAAAAALAGVGIALLAAARRRRRDHDEHRS